MTKLFVLLLLTTLAHGYKIIPRLNIDHQENVTFQKYLNFHKIQTYLDKVVIKYPHLASSEVIGRSVEGRPIRVIKISSNSTTTKPAVFMEAGIHAREWLGPPTVLHVIYQLTAMAAENIEMLNLADWYILPVANPDGYDYSWTEDRFWRKNRRINAGSECIGVDINRNFDVGDYEHENDPCSNTYNGKYPNSEPETVAISNLLISLRNRLSLYIGIHSAAQLLLYPYGYSSNKLPKQEVITAAEEAAAAAQKVRGTVYPTGNIAQTLYPAYGISVDFAADKAGATFAYGWELPEGGEGRYDPPTSEILPVAKEIWEGVKTLARHATRAPENNSISAASFFNSNWTFLIIVQTIVQTFARYVSV